MTAFPLYKQLDIMDCGPTCLRMIARHYGRSYSAQFVRDNTNISREGVSMLSLSRAAERLGLRSVGFKTDFDGLVSEIQLPCIVHWNRRHFVVVHKIKRNKVYVADPWKGLMTYTVDEFLEGWLPVGSDDKKGALLLLEPTPAFYESEDEVQSGYGFASLFKFLLAYKALVAQIGFGLLAAGLLQLIFPFLNQAVIDVGINGLNMSFIYLVLIAQIMLFLGRTSIEFIRSWLLLHISSRINLSILSNFLVKLLRLPVSFFDTKVFGDIIQRINDHQQIERFLTGSSITTVFSLANLLTFGLVLAYYDQSIFVIFLLGSSLYAGWVLLFFSRRRKLNFKRFEAMAKEEGALIELIGGMQDIKLANAELQKRRKWETIQARLFKLNLLSLSLNQYQQAGASFLNEGKNILITFIAARAVVTGDLSLGGMLAVQYIIGQLNSPIEQIISFLQSYQDAKISLERLNEIHNLADEEPLDKPMVSNLPDDGSLSLDNVTFHYPGAVDQAILQRISLHIPVGKTTAIVGTSGSGKTTLLKLLLKFYTPTAGDIRLGDISLSNVSYQLWRSKCGVVMQDGYIFSDTIAQNIAIGAEEVDMKRLVQAAKTANIHEFIQSLLLGYQTRIGSDGVGLSQGQKQRILIARAIYKNPDYMFFDEATNALDSKNESQIMTNLNEFFQGRTVVVVAHRLSTVKHAHQIIVLEKGKIVEQGSHYELVYQEGKYFELVKNQLELGQ
ncbi:peptidase domain-containing ABC transporter [Spirosoma linguale]|uniref:ABC transporter related protein n=1 Tax=Spirosoma linguale (strain ATCC 33905 / DSM 74 / LMG 10896 / Claus 1) TaxID=504472 RepID=D2QPM0_SPILD|nr:ABC transporter related protein [Spirosoma linguale DSM 74]